MGQHALKGGMFADVEAVDRDAGGLALAEEADITRQDLSLDDQRLSFRHDLGDDVAWRHDRA